MLYQFYQDSVRFSDERGEVYISLRKSPDGKKWFAVPRVIGPVPFSGAGEPFVYSALVRENGELIVSVTQSAEETILYRSVDEGSSFAPVYRLRTERTSVAPKLFNSSDGSIVLFVNENVGGLQTIVTIHSPDGLNWSEPKVLENDPEVGLAFLPVMASIGDRDFVAFQGINIGISTSYQLYLKESTDGGRNWTGTRRLTSFVDPTQTDDPDLYDNQRADLIAKPGNDGYILVWERRYQNGSPQIFLAELNTDGEFNGYIEEVTGRFDLARFPRLVIHDSQPVLVWFTNPRGVSRIILGRRGQFRWETTTVSVSGEAATFATIADFEGRVHLVWQRARSGNTSQVVYLETDQSVPLPSIVPVNFRLNERSARTRPEFTLRDPNDVSGIRAYSYVWNREPGADVPETATLFVPDRRVVETADGDGDWYLHVKATDFAGNWSEATTVRYTRDTTPPPAVTFPAPQIDENAFLSSNTFSVRWNVPEAEDLEGYSVRFDYLGSNTDLDGINIPVLPVDAIIDRTDAFISRENIDNGLWLLTVAPVDTVGNLGTTAAIPLRLNKFIPFTAVYSAGLSRDAVGRYSLQINGRGFTSDGTITSIVLDRNGTEPFDYEFFLRRRDYRVDSDRSVSGLIIEAIEAGRYQLGLRHEERGYYTAPRVVQFDPRGIIKYGDFSVAYAPDYQVRIPPTAGLTARDVLFFVVLAAAVALALVATGRLLAIGHEIRVFNTEAKALLERKTVEQLRMEEKTSHMKVEGLGLRVKFAFSIVLLVFSVVLVVAIVLGRNILNRQEQILIAGLQDRVELLVEGVVTGSRTALENPQLNVDQLQTLASQSETMDDALYTTITGISNTGESVEAVYATNDPEIVQFIGITNEENRASKIDTDAYTVGISRIDDEITPEIVQLAQQINRVAAEQLGDVPRQLADLSAEARRLILQGAGEDEIAAIDEVRSALLRQAQDELSGIAGPIRSTPGFSTEQLDLETTEFLFYKPVLDLVAGAAEDFRDYYRGTVRVAVSTQLIIDQVQATQREIILSTTIIAVVAIAFGILGAYILATIVVIPIDKLVKLVSVISETEDKSELKGKSLSLRSRDELSLLANSINEMTEGLVKAAEANKDLMFGKETQKMFIPLEKISDERKKTTGEIETEKVHFFGYYEGAKGVSGDYFSYQPLGERYYAMIKCDVAGKGIPAALIMVQVATVFLDYFRNWSIKNPGLNVSALVTRMNDLVAEREFKGRFAALTTGILDAKTGAIYMTNAGDNQVHIFRKNTGTVEQSSLASTPAAGVFTTDFIPSGFPQEQRILNSGDIMLLFTDGLEEAKRLLRDENYRPILATEEHAKAGFLTEHVPVGSDGEEFGISRIHEIVSAVQTGSRYQMKKVLDPAGDDIFEFDFSASSGSVADSVLAIVSLERLFRLYRSPAAGPENRVKVDRTIVDFLEKYYTQFDDYFGHPLAREEGGEYVEYSHLEEDEQYDDITMLALLRK